MIVVKIYNFARYGPFWIAATLIFAMSLCSNLNSYIINEKRNEWYLNYEHFSFSCTLVYFYILIIAGVIYGYSTVFNLELKFTSLLCLFGYSLLPYIPAVILSVIPYSILIYLFLILAFAYQGYFLYLDFWPLFQVYKLKLLFFYRIVHLHIV